MPSIVLIQSSTILGTPSATIATSTPARMLTSVSPPSVRNLYHHHPLHTSTQQTAIIHSQEINEDALFTASDVLPPANIRPPQHTDSSLL